MYATSMGKQETGTVGALGTGRRVQAEGVAKCAVEMHLGNVRRQKGERAVLWARLVSAICDPINPTHSCDAMPSHRELTAK